MEPTAEELKRTRLANNIVRCYSMNWCSDDICVSCQYFSDCLQISRNEKRRRYEQFER